MTTIEEAVDWLLEEGVLVPVIGGDGTVQLVLSPDHHEPEKCDERIELIRSQDRNRKDLSSWVVQCKGAGGTKHLHWSTVRWWPEGG